MTQTRVKDLMAKNPELISPDNTLEEAAQKMKSLNCGILPVGTEDKPEGIITDRDIVLSAVAEGRDINQERVKDHMTSDIFCCQEDDTLEEVARQMHEHQVNRLLVKDENGKISGILSFGRILRKNNNAEEVAKVIECAVGIKNAA